VHLPGFRVLGTRVNAVQIPDVISWIGHQVKIKSNTSYVAVTGMHGVVEAYHDPSFHKVLEAAGLVVPDGMPLVYLGRVNGYKLRRRVYGPELMLAFCQHTGSRYGHFFYGGAPGVPEQLAEILKTKFGIRTLGTYSPPFRALTQAEESHVIARINDASPDILWVGLSTPKQERWMHEYRNRLRVPVLLGVGAAFDLNTGRLKQAPRWMREHCLEWLFRLLMEPKRLWHRYLVCGSQFVWYASLEVLSLKLRTFKSEPLE
jgi:N-acetylglucosaminyldiphosphoundecaprenol N-acetyl-beta-D-mannosaminyltransferase